MTVAQCLEGRKNNFDHLRLLAAVAVIVSHSFAVLALPEPAAPFFMTTWGGVGVAVFMLISGFLVTKSWFKTENAAVFLKSRFLRIFPALLVMIFLTVFVLGPLVTELPARAYFRNPDTYKYLLSDSVIYIRYTLPGVFGHTLLKDTVNGSIWTLRFEFVLYFVLAFLGAAGLLRRKEVSLAVFCALLALTPAVHSAQLEHLIYLPCYFFAGVVFYLYRDTIVLKAGYAAVALMVFVLASFVGRLGAPMFVVFGAYLIFYFALTPRIRLPQLTRIGDMSYGLYIYAFPVQQTLVRAFRGKIGYAGELVLTLLITGILAFCSWHLIERRALALKNRPLLRGPVPAPKTPETVR